MSELYLLTGAAGYLGGAVARELIARGKALRALALPGDPAACHIPPEAEVITGDLLSDGDLEAFFAAPPGTDLIVIHCAGIVTIYPEFNRKVYDANVTGTRRIADKCLEKGVKKLVYVSSSSVIPEAPGGGVMTEPGRIEPEKAEGFYSKTKAEATKYVLDLAKYDLDASVVYPTAICGPGDFAFGHLARLMADCANGKLPAGVRGCFDAADVRDLAAGIAACAERGRPGEGYILGGGRLVTVRELLATVSRLTGAREVKRMLPLGLARALVPFAQVYYRLAKRPPFFTAAALYNLTRNNNYSSEKARRDLGYMSRPFEETAADMLDWLGRTGKLGPRPSRPARMKKARRAKALS